MATRPLMNAQALPALLEPFEAVLLAAAGAATQLGSGDAGILRVSPVWIVTYAALVLGMLQLRGLYSWRFRVSVLDDLRGILAATALASMAVLSLRILLPGDVD